jgi:hypothetical protein
MSSHHRAALFVSLIVALSGCSADRETTVPVTGVVEFKGAPLANVSVTFTPESGRPANGITRDDGTFELTTYEAADGAVVGNHTVTIAALADSVPEEIPENYSYVQQGEKDSARIPRHYADAALSGLKAEVQANGENRFRFALKEEAPEAQSEEQLPSY